MNPIVINQFQGLGDIIFCQAIAQNFLSEGREVIWPVRGEWVEGLSRAYPTIRFVNMDAFSIDYENKTFRTENGFDIIPLRFSDSITGVKFVDCMKSKYKMFNKNWEHWNIANFIEQTPEREIELLSYLDIQEPYVITNRIFKSDGSGFRQFNALKTNKRIIDIKPFKNFSIFDWIPVLIGASEIHTVGTALIYLLELIGPNCPIYVYKRIPQNNHHRNYDYILRSNDYRMMP